MVTPHDRLLSTLSSDPFIPSPKHPPSAPTAIRCSSLLFMVSERKRQSPRHLRVMHWYRKAAEQWVTALKASPVPMNMSHQCRCRKKWRRAPSANQSSLRPPSGRDRKSVV